MRQLGQARRPLIALLICVVSLTSMLLTPVVAAKTLPTTRSAADQAPSAAAPAPASAKAPTPAVATTPATPAAPTTKVPSSQTAKSGTPAASAAAKAGQAAPATAQTTTSGKTASSARIQASQANIMLLAHLIQAEAGIEPYLGKVAVGAVVINRMMSGKFPKTLAGVIYQNNQFEPVSNGTIDRAPSADSIKAARDAIAGWDPTGGALYFFDFRTVTNSYLWARPWSMTIGTHRFTY